MLKTIEFFIDWDSEFNSNLDYKIIASCEDFDRPDLGCDIYRVETDDPNEIRVIFPDGIEYVPCEMSRYHNGIYNVTAWKAI